MNEAKANFFKTTKHIADKIIALRRALNLTQEEFANCINVERRTISRAEVGQFRPSGETLEAISLVFNVPISYFFDNSKFELKQNKKVLINEITAKLNIKSVDKLNKINQIIDVL